MRRVCLLLTLSLMACKPPAAPVEQGPVTLRIAVKPTSSIAKPQTTIDHDGITRDIETHGRHDPCIVPRIIPVIEKYSEVNTMKTVAGFVSAALGSTLSFDYLAKVRNQWEGPMVVKGILSPADARRCVDAGADAIQVSNHGGRQLDGTLAGIEALPAVVAEVGSSVPVLLDSGVRSGLDVARALALGASFVFCGRPFMFGLGALGPEGAAHAYEILRDGLINVMYQTGCNRTDELSDRLVA